MTGDCRQGTVDDLLIPRQIFNEMLSHCKAAYPNEACGILAGRGSKVVRIYPIENTEASPVSYLMDPAEQFAVVKDLREHSLSMLAIFHSHPSSPAFPSPKDVDLAFYDDSVYIIVGLMEKNPEAKGYLIRNREVKEIPVVVED